MDDAALNGDLGPKAQADAVLAEVTRRLTAAISGIQIQPGDADTVVHAGFPFTVIEQRGGDS